MPDEVSTGSSDRVSTHVTVEFARTITRSHPTTPSGLPAWGPRFAPGIDCLIVVDFALPRARLETSSSITRLIFKEETSDLNGRSSVHRWTNVQRAYQTALAIDARVDTADGLTA